MKNKEELSNFISEKMCLKDANYIFDMLVEFEEMKAKER